MSQPLGAGGKPVKVECIIPILNVSDLAASLRFYTDLLGFKLDWKSASLASISWDVHAIMLCQQDQGHAGTWIWIGVEDIQPLFDAYTARGVKIRQPPTNRPWAYEMQIEDPDGHILRMGADPKTDQPFV